MTSVFLSGDLGAPAESVDDGSASSPGPSTSRCPLVDTWKPLVATLLLVIAAALVVCARVYTLEGPRFTAVFRAATLGGLGLAVLTLLQTCAQWRQVGGILARLGRSPLAPAFIKVRAFRLDWRLSFACHAATKLSLLMAETDALEALFPKAAQPPADVPLTSQRAFRERDARHLLVWSSLIPETTLLATALRRSSAPIACGC